MVRAFVHEYVLLFLICNNFGGNCQDFGYDGDEGPSHWSVNYVKCAGKVQSPIDIDTIKVVNKQFPPLHFHHFGNRLDEVLFENNGHTVIMKIMGDPKPTIKGGPLKNVYKFSQLHFHWGPNNSLGSENQINHHSFPLELHLVTFNEKYKVFDKALNSPDGITVLSFLFLVGSRDNEKFDKFMVGLREVKNLFSNKTLHDFVSLDSLLTIDRRHYFTYDGSLTTPPCSEHVQWIEFEHSIPISTQQLELFRSLHAKHGLLDHNFRPPQPLNDRIIYYNSSASRARRGIVYETIFLVIVIYFWNI